MQHLHSSRRVSSLRALVSVAVGSMILGGTAFAQSPPLVRVTSRSTAVTSRQHGKGDFRLTASRGSVLEVVGTVGDRYAHRETNWYWVLVPRDQNGTRLVGWVSGRDVEQVGPNATDRPTAPAASGAAARPAQPASEIAGTNQGAQSSDALARGVAPGAPGAATAGDSDLVSEVVLHFEFGKSDLTGEAKARLAEAVVALKGRAQSISFALEGHADSVGPEAFNERLGLARAEAVKQYLAEQYQIAVERIAVTSYGEREPVASNATREGRAQNRRVVVKVQA